MDGTGCWHDDVFVERLWRSAKCEEVYLHASETMSDVRAGLAATSPSSTSVGCTPRFVGAPRILCTIKTRSTPSLHAPADFHLSPLPDLSHSVRPPLLLET
jgi:hypothetical protein